MRASVVVSVLASASGSLSAWAATAPSTSLDTPAELGLPELVRDGPRPLTAVRLASFTPSGLREVELRYPSGARVRAGIDEDAVVEVRGADAPAVFERLRLHRVRALMPSAGLWRVRGEPGEDGLAVAARLAAAVADGTLGSAMPDVYLRHRVLIDAPSDPRFSGQWYLAQLDVLAAWSMSTGSPETTIVIIDNGCDLAHPDLVDKLDPGRDVIANDDDPSYAPNELGNEHGTACAGLAAATTDNGVGIAGVCPECRLRCVRLIPDGMNSYVPLSADVAAFQFAFDVDAAVVSNSWGFADAVPVPSALETAVNHVFDDARGGRGALVLFAAGNESRVVGDQELLAVRGVLGVGAVNNYGEKTQYTNSGNALDVVAPTGTLATDISGSDGESAGDYTERFGGTSSACPVAAGIAGLLVSVAPEATAAELTQVLIDTAKPSFYAAPDANGHDPVYGYGLIDPVAALEAVGGHVAPPPAPGDEGGVCASVPAGWAWVAVVALALRRARRPAKPR